MSLGKGHNVHDDHVKGKGQNVQILGKGKCELELIANFSATM